MRWLSRLLDLIYPPACAACDAAVAAGVPLCPPCAVSVDPLGDACPRCAEPVDAAPAGPCARCRTAPPPFAGATAPYRYGGELAAALRRLKYQGRAEVAPALAPLLVPGLAG